jgi:hypothetical protein
MACTQAQGSQSKLELTSYMYSALSSCIQNPTERCEDLLPGVACCAHQQHVQGRQDRDGREEGVPCGGVVEAASHQASGQPPYGLAHPVNIHMPYFVASVGPTDWCSRASAVRFRKAFIRSLLVPPGKPPKSLQ